MVKTVISFYVLLRFYRAKKMPILKKTGSRVWFNDKKPEGITGKTEGDYQKPSIPGHY
jgi:hypothetical protein